MIYVKFFKRKGLNMPKDTFRKLCKQNNYNAHEVTIAATAEGWMFFGYLGLNLEDFIALTFPTALIAVEVESATD